MRRPVLPAREQLRGGLWPMKAGRNRRRRAARVVWILKRHRLDYLGLTEARAVVPILRRVLRPFGYEVLTAEGRIGAADTCLVVRRRLVADLVDTIELERTWWGHKAGRVHFPRTIPIYIVESRCLVVFHGPPGVSWPAGIMRGKVDRREAYREFADTLAAPRLVADAPTSRKMAVRLFGDANSRLRDSGPYSIGWIADRLRTPIRRGRRIDVLLAREGRISNFRVRARHGSDHALLTWLDWLDVDQEVTA